MANTRRIELVLDTANLTGDVTSGVPGVIMRANLHNEVCDPNGTHKPRSDGSDFRAFESDGVGGWTPIPLEVVAFEYDSATNAGDAYVHIIVGLSGATVADGATVALEYGDTGTVATQPAADAQYGSQEVYQDWVIVSTDMTRNEVDGEVFTIDGTTVGSPAQDGPNGLKLRGMGLPANGGVGVTDSDGISSTNIFESVPVSIFNVTKRTAPGGNGTGYARYKHRNRGLDWYSKDDTNQNKIEYENLTTDGEYVYPRPATGVFAAQSITGYESALPKAFINGVKQTITQQIAPVGAWEGNTNALNLFGHGADIHFNDRQFSGLVGEKWIFAGDKSDAFHEAWGTMMDDPASFAHLDSGGLVGNDYVIHFVLDHTAGTEAGFIFRIYGGMFTGGAAHPFFDHLSVDAGNLRVYTDDSRTTRLPVHVAYEDGANGGIDVRFRVPSALVQNNTVTIVLLDNDVINTAGHNDSLGAGTLWTSINGAMITSDMVKDSVPNTAMTVGATIIDVTADNGMRAKEFGQQNAGNRNGKLTTSYTDDFEDFTIFYHAMITQNDNAARQFFNKGSTIRGENDSGERPGIVRTHADGSNTWEAGNPPVNAWRTRMFTCDDSVSGSVQHYVNGANQALTTNNTWTPPHTSSAGSALVIGNGTSGTNAASQAMSTFWLFTDIKDAFWARMVANNFINIATFWTPGTPYDINVVSQIDVPVIGSAAAQFVPTLTLQSNSSLTAPLLDIVEDVRVPTLTLQSNSSLTLANIENAAALYVPVVTPQTNTQLVLGNIASALELFAVAPTGQSNASISLIHQAGAISLFAPTLNPVLTLGLAVPYRPSDEALFAITLTPQANASFNIVHTVNTANLYAPTLSSVANPITVPFITGAVTIHSLTPTGQTNSQLSLTHLASTTVLHSIALEAITADTIVLPVVFSNAQVFAVTPSAQANQLAVIGRRTSFLDLYDVNLVNNANSGLTVAALPPTLNLRPVTFVVPNPDPIDIPFISSSLVLTSPSLIKQSNSFFRPATRFSFLHIYDVTLQEQTVPAITVPYLDSQLVLDAPFLSTGTQFLQIPKLTGAATLFAPTITDGGNASIVVPLLGSGLILNAPSVTSGNVQISLGFIQIVSSYFAPTLQSLSPDSIAIPHIASGATLHAVTMDDGGGLKLNVPHLASTLRVSHVRIKDPAAAIPVGGPRRPVILGLGVAEWKDWTGEHLPKNFIYYNSSPGSMRAMVDSGRYIPQTHWLYVNPGEVINIRPARASQQNGWDVDPGNWSFKWEIQPNTGGGLGVENLPNTATITLGGSGPATEIAPNIFKRVRDLTGATDTQLVAYNGGANGGWIRFFWWGPEKYENDTDLWRPETIEYISDYDYVRFMNPMSAINSRITRASDWLDDTAFIMEYTGQALSGDPATLNHRDRYQAGFRFNAMANLCVATNTIGFFCFPVGIGAYTSEYLFWTQQSQNGGAAAFRDAIQADGANILPNLRNEWFLLGIKFFTALLNEGYPDNLPALLEVGNENWNNQYWINVQYLVGLGRYIRSVFTGFSNKSDLGNGHGWVTAAMMDGFGAARDLIKPNQVFHGIAGVQTATNTFNLQGFTDGWNMYVANNPATGANLKLSEVFASTTSYWSGTNVYLGGGFLSPPANSHLTFVDEWKRKQLEDEHAFFTEQAEWLVTANKKSSIEWGVIQNQQFYNFAVSRGFRGLLQYEGSSHNNYDGTNPKSQSLVVVYPASDASWGRFIVSSQAEWVQDSGIVRYSKIPGTTPAVLADPNDHGWKPHVLPVMNFKDIGRGPASTQPWNERTPEEGGIANWPTVGAAASWRKFGRLAQPADLDNSILNIPNRVSELKLYAPAFGDQLAAITPDSIVSSLQLYPPDFPANTLDLIDLPFIAGAAQVFDVAPLSQTDEQIVLPLLDSEFTPYDLFLTPSDATQFIVPKHNNNVQFFSPTLPDSGNSAVALNLLTNATSLYTPFFYVLLPAELKLPELRSVTRLHEPQFDDSVTQGDSLVETNPFSPNIPPELHDVLPAEASNYLQNLAETLRDVYQKIQSGTAVFPAALLRYLDDEPQFLLGAKARFYHTQFGFITAQYVQFYEDSVLGAPAGISIYDTNKATTELGGAQKQSLLGVVAGAEHPAKDQFGWLIVDGRTIQPMLAATDVATGDELVWSATGAAATKVAGAILGRYRGLGVVAGDKILAGDVEVLYETNTAGRLLVELQSVNSRLSALAVVDETLSASITTLTTEVDKLSASVIAEIRTRVDNNRIIAEQLNALGASFDGKIDALFTTTQQAIADSQSATIQLFEQAYTGFVDSLSGLQKLQAATQSQLSQIVTGQSATAEAINSMAVGLENTALGVAANASAISTINTAVSNINGTLTAQAGSISSLQASVNSLNGQTDALAQVIVAQSARIDTNEANIANIEAQWGVTVNAGGRVTGLIRLTATQVESTFDILADKFRVFNGVTDIPILEVKQNNLFLKGVPLDSSVLAQEGNRLLPIAVGIAQGTCRDGVPVSYSVPWAAIPAIIFHPGGKMYESGFGTIQEQVFVALNPTTSGFTPSLKLRNVTGIDTPVTETGTIADPNTAIWRIIKTQAGEDKNDTYSYKYNVRVPQFPGEPNSATVTFYARGSSGAAWVARATQQFAATTFNAGTLVSVDGLGLNAEFGLGIDWTNIPDSFPSSDFISVSYTMNNGGNTVSATPAGVASVMFTAVGNKGTI